MSEEKKERRSRDWAITPPSVPTPSERHLRYRDALRTPELVLCRMSDSRKRRAILSGMAVSLSVSESDRISTTSVAAEAGQGEGGGGRERVCVQERVAGVRDAGPCSLPAQQRAGRTAQAPLGAPSAQLPSQPPPSPRTRLGVVQGKGHGGADVGALHAQRAQHVLKLVALMVREGRGAGTWRGNG